MAETDIVGTIVEFLRVLLFIISVYVREFLYLFVARPRKSINNKVVLLTGAGQGLGRKTAQRLGKLGARCVLVDINKDSNEEVANELRTAGHQAWAFQCDISSEEQIRELHRRILAEVGPVDIVINNAAIVNCQDMLEIQSARIRKNFEVNTLSHFWMIREFLPGMKERVDGHIVAISSIAGMIGTAYLTDYCASKFAVRGLMMALEEELYTQGYADKIHLTTVCPVAVNTGMFHAPKARFAWATPILEPDTAADAVIDALLTNQREVVVPTRIGVMDKIVHCFLPGPAMLALQRFIGYEVGPHKEAASVQARADAKKGE